MNQHYRRQGENQKHLILKLSTDDWGNNMPSMTLLIMHQTLNIYLQSFSIFIEAIYDGKSFKCNMDVKKKAFKRKKRLLKNVSLYFCIMFTRL